MPSAEAEALWNKHVKGVGKGRRLGPAEPLGLRTRGAGDFLLLRRSLDPEDPNADGPIRSVEACLRRAPGAKAWRAAPESECSLGGADAIAAGLGVFADVDGDGVPEVQGVAWYDELVLWRFSPSPGSSPSTPRGSSHASDAAQARS